MTSLITETSCMFSYDTDDRKNRALIKVGNSGWSPPQSFEAAGQASEAVIEREWEDDIGEAHLGVSIEHGLGQVLTRKTTLIIVQTHENCDD
jgi:vacuolar protein sorting-associated protein 13A/C